MTLNEVALHLGVSAKTVKRLGIPFTRIGRQRRYHPALVEKYELSHSNLPVAWKSGIENTYHE